MKRDGKFKLKRTAYFYRLKIWISMVSIFFLIDLSNSYAQRTTGSVSGTVIDTETNLPLISATIYLSGTTVGTTTNTEGLFVLNNVPAGIFELVVRYVGYEQLILPFEIETGVSRNFGELGLHVETFLLGDIVVEATRDQEWLDKLSLFKRSFIGQSSNADQTEIMNPEILEFTIDQRTGELLADADEDLHIINKSLGYELFTELDSFRFNTKNDNGYYYHRTRFNPLETDDPEQEEIWSMNRNNTYYGSLRHFLVSLTENRADDVFNIANGEVTHVNTRRASVYGGTVRTEQLVFLVETRRDIPLIVGYQNKLRSEIDFPFVNVILVDTYGNLMNPKQVVLYGDWAKERMADLLPSDIFFQNN